MKIRHAGTGDAEEIELQMTPMIDIVFQLLIFFILTFKIVSIEGDFNIKMPVAAPSTGAVAPPLMPINVRLLASADGELAGIQLGERSLASFAELRNEVLAMIGTPGPDGFASEMEVELDCDYNLKYSYTMDAITAVSGFIDAEANRVVPLIEKIKLAPARAEP